MPDLTISIATSNNLKMLRELVESIASHTASVDYEIIVVQNDSTDGTLEYLAEAPKVRKVISNPKFLGYAAGHNMAIKAGVGRYHAVINDDMLLVTDVFDRFVEIMDRDEKIGMIAPRLEYADGRFQVSAYFSHPSFATELREALLVNASLRAVGVRSAVDYFGRRISGTSQTTEAAHVMGAFMMVRRSIISEVGLMDEKFYSGFEDQDWCRRVVAGGYKLIYEPSAIMIHYGNVSVGGWVRERAVRSQLTARLYFHRKYEGIVSEILLRLIMVFGFTIKAIAASLRSLIILRNPLKDPELLRSKYGIKTVLGLKADS